MINKIWNWIKNVFKPKRQKEVVEQSGLPIINEVEETPKQKKIRLKYSGGLK